jgi:predicted transcriptional regulator
MKTITFEVRSEKEAFQETFKTLESGLPAQSAMFTFTSPELLWQVLNGERWEILKRLGKAGPMPIRDLANSLERDVDAVHADIDAMLNAGIVDHKEAGRISFPYKEIKVDFLLKVA